MSELKIQTCHGPDIDRHVDELARLRIEVFREWPYLYEGSAEYEARYLDPYVQSIGSIALLAWDGPDCVGASTGLPLSDADPSVLRAVKDSGRDPDQVFYFGESVVRSSYRGRGLGVRFFEKREARARSLGLKICCFCSVDRPDDHPARPSDHVPNDRFWKKRGYQCEPDTVASFDWQDIGESAETAKVLRFWFRDL